MLEPLCLARGEFLNLCADCSSCKVPYRAQPARWAACPRWHLELCSCRASLTVVALPSSWQSCALGGEALEKQGGGGGWPQSGSVGVSYR